jgi:hypothetical protein
MQLAAQLAANILIFNNLPVNYLESLVWQGETDGPRIKFLIGSRSVSILPEYMEIIDIHVA